MAIMRLEPSLVVMTLLRVVRRLNTCWVLIWDIMAKKIYASGRVLSPKKGTYRQH